MKGKDYISSGDLELYALGLLSEQDSRAIEMALQDPEVAAELARIESGLEALANLAAVPPRSALKDKILTKVQSQEVIAETEVRKVNWLQAASVTLALVSSVLAFIFWQNWQSAEKRLELALLENSQIAEQATFTNRQIDELELAMAIMTDPAVRQIDLKGLEATPQSRTFVYWNQDTKETYLQIGYLDELPPEQQYQLWSIQDGKPVNSGVFDLETDSVLIKMIDSQAPQAFAITIEPRGGSKSPTLDQMVVLGNV